MSRAVLSIGGNCGDRLAALQQAVDAMRAWLVAISPVFRTPPWGPVPQDDFLNAVIIVEDGAATAQQWLERAQAAEQAAGRTREVRWGPRTLDVDVIDVDGARSDDPELTLPHPRAAERAFVLVPWQAIEPDAVLGGVPVVKLLADLDAADIAGVQHEPGLVLA